MAAQLLVRFVKVVAVTLLAGTVTSLVVMQDFETIGAGCLLACFLIPLLVIALVLLWTTRNPKLAMGTYLSLTVFAITVLLFWYLFDPPPEAAELLLYCAAVLAGACLGGFLGLRQWFPLAIFEPAKPEHLPVKPARKKHKS